MTMKDAIRLVDGYPMHQAQAAQSDADPMVRAAASWRCQPWRSGPWSTYLRMADICPNCHLPACICPAAV